MRRCKQRQLYVAQIYEVFASYPETDHVFQLDMPGQIDRRHGAEAVGSAARAPPRSCSRSCSRRSAKIAGAQVVAFQPPPLPGTQGLPIQFVIGTTEPFAHLNDVAQKFLQEARASGLFMFLDTDLKIDKPQSTVVIDRDKAAQLGLRMSDVGSALAAMLGGGYVNYFGLDGRSYKVIPQVQQRSGSTPTSCSNYYIRTAERGVRAAVHRRAHRPPAPCRSRSTTSSSSTPRRSRAWQCPACRSARAVGFLQDLAARDTAAGLFGRLRRAVAAIRAGDRAASCSRSASR